MTTSTDNGAVLTAHHATIQTARVHIQTLRVGPKQVTMGLFRQLPYRNLIAWDDLGFVYDGADVDDAVYCGIPWGHVNYWWDGDYPRDCAYTDEWGRWMRNYGEKRHIVWQREDQLWRVILCERLPTWVEHAEEYADRWTPEALRIAWAKVWRDLTMRPQLVIAV